VLVVFLVLAGSAAAQEETALVAPADLYKEPEGVPLVSLPAGAPVETGRARGGWHSAVVEGWIFTPSTERTRRDGFDLVVRPDNGENLRDSPNGAVVGRVRAGTLLERVAVRGNWTHVRRKGWIPRKSLPSKAASAARAAQPTAPALAQQPAAKPKGPAATAAAATAPAATASAPAADAGGERIQTARETPLAAAAEGGTLGTLQGGTPARILARAGDMVKVSVEGWIPADAVVATDSGAMVGVTAEEVRATPDRFVGQTVDWRLQLIAVKQADELRSEMPPGQPYLLTRGPLPEPGFVYVTIPAGRATEFQALPPLQELRLRVTIRAAHTKFLATPVAELVSVVSGMEGK
jgi:hypothetical protein